MDFTEITNEYYLKWFDVTVEIMYRNGIILIESS